MLVNFTVRQLAYFVGAAETGSTTEAAQRFFMNQSSMSASLTDLENALGVQLFIRRRGKGLELTPTGHRLLPEARRLVREAEEFGSLAGTLQHSLSGTLAVGCFTTIAPALLPPLIKAFEAAHPQVQIEIFEGSQDQLYEALNTGRIELSLMYDYNLPADLDFDIFTSPVPHVLVAAAHPVAALPSVDLREMANEPLLMIDTEPARPLIMALFDACGLSPNIRFSTSNFDHIKSLVHQGMGFSMISQVPGATPRHWSSELVAVPLSNDAPLQHVVLASVPRSRLTHRAGAFRDFCLASGDAPTLP